MSITTCPSSAAGADRAAVELVADDQPAADAGPDRQHHRLARAPRGAGAVLGERGRVRVVVHEHGQPDPLGHHVAEGDARPAAGGRRSPPSRCAGRSGPGSRSRRRRSRRRSTRAASCDRVQRRVEQRRLVETGHRALRAMVHAHRSSTAPASSFVPPRSTPMTRRAAMSSQYPSRMPSEPDNRARSEDASAYSLYRSGGQRSGRSRRDPDPRPYTTYRAAPAWPARSPARRGGAGAAGARRRRPRRAGAAVPARPRGTGRAAADHARAACSSTSRSRSRPGCCCRWCCSSSARRPSRRRSPPPPRPR